MIQHFRHTCPNVYRIYNKIIRIKYLNTCGLLGTVRPVVPVPNVEKSKSSGLSSFSPVLSKNALSSFLERNLFPLGPMMKTSYLKKQKRESCMGGPDTIKSTFTSPQMRRFFFVTLSGAIPGATARPRRVEPGSGPDSSWPTSESWSGTWLLSPHLSQGLFEWRWARW